MQHHNALQGTAMWGMDPCATRGIVAIPVRPIMFSGNETGFTLTVGTLRRRTPRLRPRLPVDEGLNILFMFELLHIAGLAYDMLPNFVCILALMASLVSSLVSP